MEKTTANENASHDYRPRVGMGILVVRDNKFLLGKRLGKHMPGYYAAPGGHLEHGETFADCARREIFEETGLNLSSVRLLMIGNYLFDDRHYVDIDVVAEVGPGEPSILEPHKCAGWDWYSADQLPAPLFVVTARMIETYINGAPLNDQVINELVQQKTT
jgi:8-oxo-dGTP diphosphatase